MTSLILVPTHLELNHLLEDPKWSNEHGVPTCEQNHNLWAVCGIGAAASAFTAGQLLREMDVERVLLLGIAGAYRDQRMQPGDVIQASSEVFADLGYRDNTGYHTFDEMRLPILPGAHGQWGCRYDVSVLEPSGPKGAFLTLNSVTTDLASGALLARQFGAVAENMEGAGVAMACAWFEAPFYEVRAISNLVGPRDPKSWLIETSLDNLRQWLEPHL